ncbi:transposon Tf2-11 polyprotein [Trichonephila clavipes]|nr:transposon Tf2-11 polyprotein [Trichonephila clavipes]
MEAIPIPEITAEIVGRAFSEKWICRFGVPAKLVTDQGRQFEAELFRSIAAICGAKVAHTQHLTTLNVMGKLNVCIGP